MKNQDKTKLTLLLTGFILIILTYFYYPNLGKKNILENKNFQKDLEDKLDDKQSTAFETVSYDGIYNNKSFTLEADRAHILQEDDRMVYMKGMHLIMYLDDGRVVNIYSNKGKFSKETYDSWFEGDVFSSDGETEIFSDNLDLLATENFLKIYNNVNLNHNKGSLKSDRIDFDFETKNLKITMVSPDETIKMKVFE